MKVAFVVPRYGPTVVGGAETAARLFAEGLVSQMSWDVEVLTSCARGLRLLGRCVPTGRGDDQRRRGHPLPVLGRPGPVVPPVLRLVVVRSDAGIGGRCRAVGRSAGTGHPRVDRGVRPLRRGRHDLLPVPLLPDGARHRPGARADRPPSSRPRRARPVPAGVPRGVRGGGRTGLPDGGRTGTGAAHLPGGLPPPAAAGARRRRPRPYAGPPGSGGPSLPPVPRAGRPSQGNPSVGLPLRHVQGPPPGAPPAGVRRPGDRASAGPPRRRRGRHRARAREMGPPRKRRCPGVAVVVRGLLPGGGGVVERPDPGVGQRGLRGHGGALPALRRRSSVLRVRRVRGHRGPLDRGCR